MVQSSITHYYTGDMYKIDKSDINKKNDDEDIEKKRMSITVRGLSGLVNLGNTCYMNSIVQCLCHVPMFGAYFRDKRYLKSLIKNSSNDINITITEALSDLLIHMWKCNYSIRPQTLRKLTSHHNKDFVGFLQQDSQEFLNFILDKIHTEIKVKVSIEFKLPKEVINYVNMKAKFLQSVNSSEYPLQKELLKQKYEIFQKNNLSNSKIYDACVYWAKYVKDSYSVITTLFTGLEYCETICSNCGNVSSVFQPFNTISLAVPDNINECTLEQCLENYSREEILDCRYECSKCKEKAENAKRAMYIWEPPEILILYLKRFDNFGRKIKTEVNIPLKSLSLSSCSSVHYDKGDLYDLVCVSTHIGSYIGGGHYTSYCKNSLNDLWYYFDDSTVVHVPDQYIKKDIRDSYILFYARSLNN